MTESDLEFQEDEKSKEEAAREFQEYINWVYRTYIDPRGQGGKEEEFF